MLTDLLLVVPERYYGMSDIDKLEELWLEFEKAVTSLTENDRRIFFERYPRVLISTRPILHPNKLPEIDLSGKTYELFKGGKGSDPVGFLGKVWGDWLQFFRPELDKNYISMRQLRHRDGKLLRALTNKFQQATEPVIYNDKAINHLDQLIQPKLSKHSWAIASRYYYHRKKTSAVINSL